MRYSMERNKTQRKTKGAILCIHCTYCSMPKGTTPVEATSTVAVK